MIILTVFIAIQVIFILVFIAPDISTSLTVWIIFTTASLNFICAATAGMTIKLKEMDKKFIYYDELNRLIANALKKFSDIDIESLKANLKDKIEKPKATNKKFH